jgi:hypothetical protein
VDDIKYWEGEAAEILCQMEQHLPPSLFDMQSHLVVHLPQEVRLCGPVSSRWMYFIERYMGELKGWVRQRAQPEGSMAQGYIVAETMHYVTEFSTRFHPDGPKLITEGEFQKFRGIILPKAKSTKVMSPVFREQAWRFLLNNVDCLQSWRLLHEEKCDSDPTTAEFKDWLLPALTASIEETGRRPDPMVASRDVNKKTTLDRGILQMFVINGQHRKYVGYVESIIRLNFDSFETILFKAQWYASVHKPGRNATLVEDECGHLRVKEVNFAPDSSPLDKPFAFPKDVEQLYFVKDKIHKGWLLAVKVNARSIRVSYQKSRDVCGESAASFESDEDDDIPLDRPSVSRRGVPVSMEADDSAGEHVDMGDSSP